MFCLVAAVPWRFILTGTFGLQDRFFSGKLCFISFSLELINNVARLTFSDCILQNVRYWSHSWEVHSETDLCWQVTSIMGRSWIFSDNIRRFKIYQNISGIFSDNIRLKIYQGYFQTISGGWKCVRIYQEYFETISWWYLSCGGWELKTSHNFRVVFPPHMDFICISPSYISLMCIFPLIYFPPHVFPPLKAPHVFHPSYISSLMYSPLVYFPPHEFPPRVFPPHMQHHHHVEQCVLPPIYLHVCVWAWKSFEHSPHTPPPHFCLQLYS